MPRELTPEETRDLLNRKRVERIAPIPLPGGAARNDETGMPKPEGNPVAGPVAPASGRWQLVPVDHLLPRSDNPRRVDVESDAFLSLVASIRSAGIVTPLLGRPHPTEAGCVELLAGHRRRRAGMEAELTEFPVIIREMDDRTALEVLVFENLDRENLTPMEEARGVRLLLSSGHDAQEIADRMGKTRAWVARRANLLNLTGLWQKWAEEKGVSAAHLELIARWPKERQDQLHERLLDCYDFDRLWMGPGSVKALAAEIADEMRELLKAPWSLDDETLVPKAGACAVCPKRSGCQPDLFTEENEGGDRCLDPDCWDEKMRGFKLVREGVLRKEHPGLVRVIGKNGSAYENGKRLTSVLDEWEYAKCAQKTKGAVPALVVSGEGEGTLIWVTQKAGSRAPQKQLQSAAAKQAEASQDPKACEEILREKREGLAKRRTAWVIQRLIELLMEADRPAAAYDNAEAYLAMVAGFGTEPVHHGSDADEDVPEPWETTADGGLVSRRAVWEMLKPKIRQEIFFHTAGSIGEGHREGCRWLANLLGANLAVLVEESEKEIPEPKSWEGLQKLAEAQAPAGKAGKPGKPAKGDHRPEGWGKEPYDYRMVDAESADEGRALIDELEWEIELLQRAHDMKPTVGVVEENLSVGFSVVTQKEWQKSIKALTEKEASAGATLGRLVYEGTVALKHFEKLLDKEMGAPKPAKKSAKKKGQAA